MSDAEIPSTDLHQKTQIFPFFFSHSEYITKFRNSNIISWQSWCKDDVCTSSLLEVFTKFSICTRNRKWKCMLLNCLLLFDTVLCNTTFLRLTILYSLFPHDRCMVVVHSRLWAVINTRCHIVAVRADTTSKFGGLGPVIISLVPSQSLRISVPTTMNPWFEMRLWDSCWDYDRSTYQAQILETPLAHVPDIVAVSP